MTRILISNDIGCAYRWSKKYNQLEWAPLIANNILDDSEWGCVDEDIVGEEVVMFNGRDQTLSEVYRFVEKLVKE